MESSNDILLARQPIYDKDLNVYAYELLFRPSSRINPEEWDGDAATTQLILNAFTEIGIDKASDNKKAFVNFTRNWLISPPPFESRFVTVEVLETVEPDDEVIAGIRQMKDSGFTIALDDFVFDEKWLPIIDMAHIIKIDVLAYQGAELDKLVEKLKPFNIELLAEKVENYSVFEHCISLGFSYFQGYFLCRPQNIHGDTLPSNKIVIMRFLAELQNPDITIDALDNLISHDISLSTKILRICNTAQYATRSKIDSIKRAVVLIGLQALKQWASIIALSRMSDKPSELICLTLSRAKMMEILAKSSQLGNQDTFFTVGMFSLIDAFFDQPKDKVLAGLPFAESINSALLHHDGEAGKLLQAVVNHEMAQWESIDWTFLTSIGIDESLMEKAYLESILWATDIMKSLTDSN